MSALKDIESTWGFCAALGRRRLRGLPQALLRAHAWQLFPFLPTDSSPLFHPGSRQRASLLSKGAQGERKVGWESLKLLFSSREIWQGRWGVLKPESPIPASGLPVSLPHALISWEPSEERLVSMGTQRWISQHSSCGVGHL